MIVYLDTTRGCCIREGRSLEAVERATQREIGTHDRILRIREATEDDIAWVQGMGGWVPVSVHARESR